MSKGTNVVKVEFRPHCDNSMPLYVQFKLLQILIRVYLAVRSSNPAAYSDDCLAGKSNTQKAQHTPELLCRK
jgi:hypothetical protein